MNNIFNTPFEVSLRVLLTLEASPRHWVSSDWITAVDFITTYCKDFGLSDENLHGENNYKYSEFALRRELVKEALKALVSRRLVEVRALSNGFLYILAKAGGNYCADLTSDYAENYRELAAVVGLYVNGKPEREILALINKHSLSSLQRSI